MFSCLVWPSWFPCSSLLSAMQGSSWVSENQDRIWRKVKFGKWLVSIPFFFAHVYACTVKLNNQARRRGNLKDVTGSQDFQILTNWFLFQAEQPGPEGAGDAAEHGLAVSAEHGEAGGWGQKRDEDESPDQRHLCVILSVHLPSRCGGPAWPRHHQIPPGIKIHK